MPPNTSYLSTGTTVLSNLSLYGQVWTSRVSSTQSILGVDIWGSTVSSSAVSSSGSVLAGAGWFSSLSVGGTAIPGISSTSSLIAAFVVQGSASSFTVVTWAGAAPGSQILVTPFPDAAASSVSSGLVPWSHCTVAGQVEFRLSNVSTLAQNQSSKSWYFTQIKSF